MCPAHLPPRHELMEAKKIADQKRREKLEEKRARLAGNAALGR